MHHPIAVIGAPSNIGIRPYDDGGEARHIDRAPGVLRELGLVARLNADDLGDVRPPPYRDFTRPPGRARNEEGVLSYSQALADRVASVAADQFALVLGGDCSMGFFAYPHEKVYFKNFCRVTAIIKYDIRQQLMT